MNMNFVHVLEWEVSTMETRKKLGFIGLLIAMTMGFVTTTITNIALSQIQTTFHVSLTDVGWVSTIYVLVLSVFMLIAAKLADQFGRKRLMILGLLLFGFFSFIGGSATSFDVLLIARGLQALGGAIIAPLVLPMGVSIFGEEKVSFIVQIITMLTGLGTAVGVPIGGLLLNIGSWRWTFWMNVPLVLISLVLVLLYVPESKVAENDHKFDMFGMLSFGLGVFGLTFGISEGRILGWESPMIVGSLIGGVLLLGVFVWIEQRVTVPMLDLALFKKREFSASILILFLLGIGIIVPLLILNYWFQSVLGYTPLHSSLLTMAYPVAIVVAVPFVDIVADALSDRWVNFIGLVVLGLGILAMMTINQTTATWWIIIILAIIGAGFGFAMMAMSTAQNNVTNAQRGVASGTINTTRQLGQTAATAIFVAILTTHVTYSLTTHSNIATAYAHVYFIGGMVLLILSPIAFLTGRVQSN